MIKYLIKYLIKKYKMPKNKAKKVVNNKEFLDILKEYPDLVGHMGPEYWIEILIEKYKENNNDKND